MHGFTVREDACRDAIGPAATVKPSVIYMSYDGMLEPLGQSQVISYLTPLSVDFAIHLVSFEKDSDSRRGEDVLQLRDRLRNFGITWHPLRYHKRPKVVSTVYDIVRAALIAAALAHRYDVGLFHARSLLSAAMLFPAVALRHGRLIFDIRGFWIDERLDGGIVRAGSLIERTLRKIERAVCRRADHIVTLTRCSVATLREDPRFGRPDAPITVIPTCADLDVFTPGEAKAPGEPFVVGYVGQIGPWYRFAEMVALYKAFASRKPDARMLVVNRNQQEAIREALRDAGISADRFEIVAAGRSEVPTYVRRMDVGVVLMTDAFSNLARAPTKLAEYLGCGVPCVGDLRVGDLHMILDGEDVGVTMNDHSPEERERAVDRILHLRCDPGLATRCVSSARVHFSLEDGVERYRAIYRSLAGERVGCGAGAAAGHKYDDAKHEGSFSPHSGAAIRSLLQRRQLERRRMACRRGSAGAGYPHPMGSEMTFGFVERRACPACEWRERTTLVDTPLDGPVIGPVVGRYYAIDPTRLAGGRYDVVQCARCATIYQAQVAGDDLLTTLYDVWLNEVQDSDDQAGLDWLAAHPSQSRDGHELMTVATMLGVPIRGLKTLDFGMGKGLWAGIAKTLGCDSHGFDLSETRMRDARTKGVRAVAFDEIAGSGFDFINTEQVMEHVTDVRAVMAALAAGLRKGGVLKISVPAQGNVQKSLARISAGEVVASSDIIPILPLEHVNAFSPRGLEILGGNFGLRKVCPTLRHRLRFLANPANWLSAKPANTIKELVRPFRPYENDRNLTVWLTTKATS